MKIVLRACLSSVICLLGLSTIDTTTVQAADKRYSYVEFGTENVVVDGKVRLRKMPDGPPGTISINGDQVIFGLEYYSGERAGERTARESSLARELARQAILLTAREHFGHRTRDALLGESLPDKPDRSIGRVGVLAAWLESTYEKQPHISIGVVLTQQPAADAEAGVAPKIFNRYRILFGGDQKRVLSMSTTGMANATQDHYVAGLETLKLPKRPLKPSDQAELPAELIASPGALNFLVQYDRVRQLHQFIETHGPNWEAYKQLSLAYAHLGMLTEFFWSEHSAVFYARALLYAKRNVTPADPKPEQIQFAREFLGRPAAQDRDAAPLENLAYIWAIIGRHDLALETLKEYDSAVTAKTISPGKTISPSLYYARAIANGDLDSLAEPTVGTQKNLGPLLHYRLLEYSGNAEQMDALHDAAADANPNCLRVHDSLEFGKTVGILRYSTELLTSLTPTILQSILPTLKSLPKSARTAIEEYSNDTSELAARVKLMEALAKLPADDFGAGELSPQVLAAMILNRSFITADNETLMADRYLGWHTDRFVKKYRPVIAEHPLAGLIELRQPDLAAAQDGLVEIYDASFVTPAPAFRHLRIRQEVSNFARQRLKKGASYGFYGSRVDQTYHGILSCKLALREAVSSWVDSEHLVAVSPNAELPVYYQIKDELGADADLAALEKKYSDSALILPALAERYRQADQDDDRIRVLEKLVTMSDSESNYSDLAMAYYYRGEIDKWVELAKQMLKLPRQGLPTSYWETKLAFYYMNTDKETLAFEHAEHAARSYSSPSLTGLAIVQAYFGKYKDAEATFKKATERYPSDVRTWYRWAHAHGNVDLKAPERKAVAYYGSLGAPVPAATLIEIFDFYVMNKEPKKALEVFRGIERYSLISPHYLVLAAVVSDELGQTRDRDAILKHLSSLKDNGALPIDHELITKYATDLTTFLTTKDKSLLDLAKLDRMFSKAEASDNDKQMIALATGYFLATRGHREMGFQAIEFAAFVDMANGLPSTWNVMARHVLRSQGAEIGPANKGLVEE